MSDDVHEAILPITIIVKLVERRVSEMHAEADADGEKHLYRSVRPNRYFQQLNAVIVVIIDTAID